MTENQRAEWLAMMKREFSKDRSPGGNPQPGHRTPPSGGGGYSGGGGGGGGYSGGGGGGGGSRRRSAGPAMPVEDWGRVETPTGTYGPRQKFYTNGRSGPWLRGPEEPAVVVPPVVPPVIDPGTGLPVTPPVVPPVTTPPVVPPVTVDPGYQIPPNPDFAATALTVPDPVFQQFLSSQGIASPYVPTVTQPAQFSAATIGTPYIPQVNQFSAASAPYSLATAANPSPMGAAAVVNPPALNAGNLAGNYSEVGSDMFAEQPELLLRDMLNRQYGQGRAEGLYGMLEPYADNMNALYLAQAGQNAAAGNKADFTNWLASQWGNMQRPGTYTNTDLAIRNVLNPSPSSPLAAYVTEGDPQEQYRNTANLLGSAISMGYHPLFASAMMNRLKQAGLDYQGQAARGGVAQTPFYQYLQTSSGIPALSQLLGA
jgi:hypothetical protein